MASPVSVPSPFRSSFVVVHLEEQSISIAISRRTPLLPRLPSTRDFRCACSAPPSLTVAPALQRRVAGFPRSFSSHLRSLLKQGKADEAEEFMHRMLRAGVSPDLLAYNLMITINGKANRFAQAQAWFRRLEGEESLHPDTITYRSMIGACGRAGELKEALFYYGRMKLYGLQPSIHNFNTLLNLHRKMIDSSNDGWEIQILNFLSDMRQLKCAPDSSTVDVVVKLYDKFNKLKNLSNAITLMEAAGWSPTDKCHHIVIRAYVSAGLVDEALDEFWLLSRKKFGSINGNANSRPVQNVLATNTWAKKDLAPQLPGNKHVYTFDKVHTNGVLVYPQNVKPSTTVNYDTINNENGSTTESRLEEALCHGLICLCRASGRHKDGIDVYDQMRESGTSPSWLTACTIIDICGRMDGDNAVEKGRAIFDEMRSSPSGCESTDSGAYTVTINMYLKAGLIDKASEISDMVVAHEGIRPDSALFLAMLRTYSRANMHKRAVDIYKWMLKCKLTWTASMFNGVVHCCGRALPLEETVKVFLAMVHAKMPLSSVTCNLMMDIFAKGGLLEKAEDVFKIAKEQNVLNAISYNTIINGYGKYKQFSKMEYALAEMQNSGFKDYVEAYNSMLDAYGKAGRIRKMERILERMRRADCSPDLSTFNILINVYGREGMFVELQEARSNMESAGIKPNNYTFNTLIHAYGNSEMQSEAVDAFKEMQDAGLLPDEVTYNCLISAFEKCGNDLEAARWKLWMTQLGYK